MENRRDKRKSPVLYLVLPCYNEEAVLPVTIPMFLEKLEEMLFHGKIDQESRILLVDDGSRDRTWELICQMAEGLPLHRDPSKPEPWTSECDLSRDDGGQKAGGCSDHCGL